MSWPSVRSEVTTAMCDVVLVRAMKNALPPTSAAMKHGMSTVARMKPLVRTRSMYSRLAMSQMLCMNLASGLGELGSSLHRGDKDLFESGLDDLEPCDVRAARNSFSEKRLSALR
jgi:hypothetical protein